MHVPEGCGFYSYPGPFRHILPAPGPAPIGPKSTRFRLREGVNVSASGYLYFNVGLRQTADLYRMRPRLPPRDSCDMLQHPCDLDKRRQKNLGDRISATRVQQTQRFFCFVFLVRIETDLIAQRVLWNRFLPATAVCLSVCRPLKSSRGRRRKKNRKPLPVHLSRATLTESLPELGGSFPSKTAATALSWNIVSLSFQTDFFQNFVCSTKTHHQAVTDSNSRGCTTTSHCATSTFQGILTWQTLDLDCSKLR